jgi:hypothetical protein
MDWMRGECEFDSRQEEEIFPFSSVQAGSLAQLTTYIMGNWGFFAGVKAAGA